MNVWLMTVGEPLPIDPDGDRLHRTGMVAERLLAEGHSVVWWTSAFDHNRKRVRCDADACVQVGERYRIRMLYARPYRRHVSIRRILNHRGVAAAFRRHVAEEPRPDVILCSLPLIELADAAGRYGRAHGVPVIVDARDMWPDIFAELAPPCLRGLARAALFPMFRAARRACRNAAALTGITPPFVEWALAKAGRARSDADRDFPLAYDGRGTAAAATESVRERWRPRLAGNGAFTACFFGTFGRQFDIETVLGAARRLSGGPRRFQFVLCGNGDRLPQYRDLAAGCGNVLLPGWVGAEDIAYLMSRASVGLAPYRSSPSFVVSIPNKAIEYLCGGLPVLSSLSGELERVLSEGGCGLTYPNGGEVELADTLVRLYDDPALVRTMGERGRTLFEQRFEARRVYGDMVRHIETIHQNHCAAGRPAADATRG